ncbi:MAG: hypothetical protein LBL67_01400 [Coriobacteriales bacterium]|jgi:formate C-acetyltransferase|nr:hypothetical protein [Coriobacteriales bacterium]
MYEFSPVSPRVKKIHERVRNRVVRVDSERARIVMESYKANQNLPWVLKMPTATKDVCLKKTCCVDDDQIFVGNHGASEFGSPDWAEWDGCDWIVAEIDADTDKPEDEREWHLEEDGLYHNSDPNVKMSISPDDVEIIRAMKPFWDVNRVTAGCQAAKPEMFDYLAKMGVSETRPGQPVPNLPFGHFICHHEKIIDEGYAAIKQSCQDWLDAHDDALLGEDVGKSLFYRAEILICDGAIGMIKNYAQACRDKAAGTADPARKAELEKMAEGLDWISEKPARNFWEALQAALLYHIVIYAEAKEPALALGRVDQYAGKFLVKELDEGTLTLEQAQEIVDCFFLKSNCFYNAAAKIVTNITGAGNTYQHTTIGGVKPDGSDASNPMTYMVLETIGRLSMHDPSISFRCHKGTPDKLWECALATSRKVGGLPLFQNDEVVVPMLQDKLGFSLEDARNYGVIGCQEFVGCGMDWPEPNGIPPFASIWFNAIFTMAINDGKNPMNGFQSKLHTGFLYDMKSMDEVRDALRKMIEHCMGYIVSYKNWVEHFYKERAPLAAISLAQDDCLKNGKDVMSGGARYNSYGGTMTGIGTVADSLSTIKYAVFEHQICTMRELYDAVMDNWEGHEQLQARILAEVPHYGNDDPYVDDEVKWLADMYVELCTHYYSERCKVYRPGLYGASDHVNQGFVTWATPDGRQKGTPLADATSPAQGRDKSGPTAIFNSAVAFDHNQFPDGLALNIKIHPTSVANDEGMDKLENLTKTYFDNGGMEVQYNIVSSDTLRKAQKDPGSYRDLVVRIAGFSAYFVDMAPELQNDIISRNEVEV